MLHHSHNAVGRLNPAFLVLTLLSLLPIVFLAAAQCINNNGKPVGTVRREIRELSAPEWREFVDALSQLYHQGTMAWMTKVHNEMYPRAHDHIQFFPWHRQAIIEFEHRLQRINPKVTVPYWDATRDFYNPAQSPLFGDYYLGGNGKNDTSAPGYPVGSHFTNKTDITGGCVLNGVQAEWIVWAEVDQCLRRNYDINPTQITPWHSPEFIASILQLYGRLNDFWLMLEYSYHDNVHSNIGGTLNSPYSPGDLIFYLHHSNIDRLWTLWQITHPDQADDYNGASSNDDGHTLTTLDDKLDYWNVTVRDIIHKGASRDMCYIYSDRSLAGKPWAKQSNTGSSTQSHGLSLDDMKNHPLQKLPEAIKRKWFPLGLDPKWMQQVLPPMPITAAKSMVPPPPTSKMLLAQQTNNNTAGANIQSIPMPRNLPHPPPELLDETITKWHDQIEKIAAEFVNDLNGANYRSPYIPLR